MSSTTLPQCMACWRAGVVQLAFQKQPQSASVVLCASLVRVIERTHSAGSSI
jgi:hypothetical protein